MLLNWRNRITQQVSDMDIRVDKGEVKVRQNPILCDSYQVRIVLKLDVDIHDTMLPSNASYFLAQHFLELADKYTQDLIEIFKKDEPETNEE